MIYACDLPNIDDLDPDSLARLSAAKLRVDLRGSDMATHLGASETVAHQMRFLLSGLLALRDALRAEGASEESLWKASRLHRQCDYLSRVLTLLERSHPDQPDKVASWSGVLALLGRPDPDQPAEVEGDR